VNVAADASGRVYIADQSASRVRVVEKTGTIQTFAGTNEGFGGDGGPAAQSALSYPSGVATDSSGNLYIADSGNNRIRIVNASGVISTFAGTGADTSSGDGGQAIAAQISHIFDVAADPFGNVYIAEWLTNDIRKVAPDGTITTFGFAPEPIGLAVDAVGNVYESSLETTGLVGNCVNLKFTPQGTPTVLGNVCGWDIAVAPGSSGGYLVSDTNGNVIRRIAADGSTSIIAGTGAGGFGGDGGNATAALFNQPEGLAVDPYGDILVVDAGNKRVRRLSPVSASCQYFVTPSVISMPALGGAASISVSAANGCTWFVGSDSSWAVPDTIGSSASGTIHIQVTPNPAGSPRTTNVNVAGQPLQVTQAAFGCDVNGDGIVNVTDVQMSILEALSSDVSIVDVSIVINAALGEGCSTM
jgi:sugar lactone lactonase YvrE